MYGPFCFAKIHSIIDDENYKTENCIGEKGLGIVRNS